MFQVGNSIHPSSDWSPLLQRYYARERSLLVTKLVMSFMTKTYSDLFCIFGTTTDNSELYDFQDFCTARYTNFVWLRLQPACDTCREEGIPYCCDFTAQAEFAFWKESSRCGAGPSCSICRSNGGDFHIKSNYPLIPYNHGQRYLSLAPIGKVVRDGVCYPNVLPRYEQACPAILDFTTLLVLYHCSASRQSDEVLRSNLRSLLGLYFHVDLTKPPTSIMDFLDLNISMIERPFPLTTKVEWFSAYKSPHCDCRKTHQVRVQGHVEVDVPYAGRQRAVYRVRVMDFIQEATCMMKNTIYCAQHALIVNKCREIDGADGFTGNYRDDPIYQRICEYTQVLYDIDDAIERVRSQLVDADDETLYASPWIVWNTTDWEDDVPDE